MEDTPKPLAFPIKLAFFGVFIGVWVGLTVLLYNTLPAFKLGGWGMWPILAVGLVFILITVDRVRYLFFKAKPDHKRLVADVQRSLLQGNVQQAISVCEQHGDPMANIVKAGLAQIHRGDEEVQEAMDEAALYELPRIEIRTGYLAMVGNIATLLGLLGTIVGLIKSFAGVSLENENSPETQKRAQAYVHLVKSCQGKTDAKETVLCIMDHRAEILATGISEAMNCTAFGLMVGILALLAFSVLNGRTQNMLEEIHETTVQLVNLAAGHRHAMNLDPLRQADPG